MSRSAIRLSARDASATVATRSALVIAPHPDDETIGCGATILHKVAAGTQVTVLVATDGSGSHHSDHLPPDQLAELRRSEMAEAARRLGLPPDAVRWGGLVDGTVAQHTGQLAALIHELIVELNPQEVYTTSADEPHPDHAAVGRAARQAVAAHGGKVELLEYTVWLWGSWPLRRNDRLRSTIDAFGRVLRRRAVRVPTGPRTQAKLYALAAHRSQLERPAGVPAGEQWQGLPPQVLADAADRVELFFPVRPRQPWSDQMVARMALLPIGLLAWVDQLFGGLNQAAL